MHAEPAPPNRDERPLRVLVAKVGLDGHDRGAHVVSRSLRDAGFEVIYSGLHNSPEEIVRAAVQEDVDVVGISILSGAHGTLVPAVVEGLDDAGVLEEMLVLVGGIVPEADRTALREAGVAAVFGPGTPTGEIVEYVRANASGE